MLSTGLMGLSLTIQTAILVKPENRRVGKRNPIGMIAFRWPGRARSGLVLLTLRSGWNSVIQEIKRPRGCDGPSGDMEGLWASAVQSTPASAAKV